MALHKWDIMQGFVTNGVINGKSVVSKNYISSQFIFQFLISTPPKKLLAMMWRVGAVVSAWVLT